ncbi:Oxidoreductase molybdopterin binding domain [Rubrobacter radiotolerans]|uniref:Molybdopterin-dependent oxidoreductase n=1 Tax=Rubrobacter radiotolerans TaxID=42256 RepID=A0A023X025_RUBRA|nr:molybdopterin-dependent oxidoreductase [Rubrobacter radiotolerans]AHY45832.1 Oxidoreductase molybdopterin binding domain [Rubrobacter radiotolerans]MDX5893246.1 molybdopterin-dependent oxidoreductase [Rubrobacter radiotolerans]SMC03350.1 DMSO/TMAO reductase YedYZ, molybdopterin-dependent catalytic subunit [Rubrobacter radiotolerans DSM 5868]
MGRGARAAVAGVAGAVLAFGLAEFVHGIYDGVPSVFTALAQGVIELTPGGFATRAIEALGTADIPVLIASMIVGALVVAALLANLRLRSGALAMLAVVGLAAVALAAVFTQPAVVAVPTVLTIAGALAAGSLVAEGILRRAGLVGEAGAPGAPEPPPAEQPASPSGQMAGVRRRDAHSGRGVRFDRRAFLALSGGAAAAGLALVGAGRFLAGSSASESTSERPLRLSDSPGERTAGRETTAARDEVANRTLPPVPEDAKLAAVEDVTPLVTPAADFYLIDTALTSPRVDRESWSLKVGGAGVANPLNLSYSDLLSMPTREVDCTLACVSNEVGGGLVSNARWTGVMLSDVLNEAGVTRETLGAANEQLVGRSVDGWTAGFRTDLAFDGREAILAFGMNGNELPVRHGYPVRLVVPGLYGYVSATKWLQEIELTDWDFDAYWIQRTWTKEGPIKTQSRIDTVSPDEELSAGVIPVGGVAWAPHRGVSRVEVSTDGGESWNEAELAAQLSEDTWRQFVYNWEASPGEYTLQVCATDGEGVTQTATERGPHGGGGTDGATGYHTINVVVA